MKKHLACPEYKVGLALQSTESITMFLEPDNLDHPLQLATEILKLINSYVENKAKEHTVVLDQFKKASQTTLPETLIATIEKFQNFYSRPVVLTLPYRRFTFSLEISPYKLALIVNILISFVAAIDFWLLASEAIGGKARATVNDFDSEFYTSWKEFSPQEFKKDFFAKDISSSPNIVLLLSMNIICSFMKLCDFFDHKNIVERTLGTTVDLLHMLVFGIPMVIFNEEISLNPMTYSNLSNRFDKMMQYFDSRYNGIKRKEHQASIDTYCVTSSIAISEITFSGLFLIINNIGILLTQLIEKSISAQEPVLKKVAYEKTNLETWIERSTAELLKKVSEQNLTPEDKEELDQTIKKLAMENLIEMLEKTSNPPHETSDTEALLNQKLMDLLAKVKTESATKENSDYTIKIKFENIARTVEDFVGMEVPLFPVLHLEAGETIFGIRELSCITSSEVRMPKDPYFQETEKDRNSLNTLIKQLLRGETGYINNRSTTSVENDPRIEAYPIQFSKELFPAFLFLSLIQKIIEGIEEIEELPNSALNLQSLSRRPVAFVPQE